jgi:protocatechuate 3,4-dioxygenase, beta subunit
MANISRQYVPRSRRGFLRDLGRSAAFLAIPGLFADALVQTPRQTEGPFYPDHLPLDTDNDLIVINDGLTPAVGEITHLTGRVVDGRGDPIRNALVEIWQVDNHGVYLHTASAGRSQRDAHFQGFGRFLTGTSGEYYFRTIKPRPYPGRTPHIHFAIKLKGRDKWTTQCYVRGEPQNERDRLFRGIADPKARESVLVDFVSLPDSRGGELSARFDIVMGFTPTA